MKHAEVEFPTMLPGDSLVPLELRKNFEIEVARGLL